MNPTSATTLKSHRAVHQLSHMTADPNGLSKYDVTDGRDYNENVMPNGGARQNQPSVTNQHFGPGYYDQADQQPAYRSSMQPNQATMGRQNVHLSQQNFYNVQPAAYQQQAVYGQNGNYQNQLNGQSAPFQNHYNGNGGFQQQEVDDYRFVYGKYPPSKQFEPYPVHGNNMPNGKIYFSYFI